MASNDNDLGNDHVAYDKDSNDVEVDDADDDDDDDDEAPDLIVIDPTPPSTTTDNNDCNSNTNSNSNSNSNPMMNSMNKNKQNSKQKPCPVTILSGFLGSGKTTLIQYILKSTEHGKRIAVIENEFGDGLDVESLIARDGIENEDNNNQKQQATLQELIELPNGCVCCTVKDALVETLELLIDKRPDLDYILIEASGMADPGPIASIFWLDVELESRLTLDGIVTLVDARNILSQLRTTEEAARQIAYADRIVLNKIDLVSSVVVPPPSHFPDTTHDSKKNTTTNTNTTTNITVEMVEQAIRNIHPTAPILKTSFSKIPNLDWILDANCFGQKCLPCGSSLPPLPNIANNNTTTNNTNTNDDDHTHTSSISSVAFEIKGSVNLQRINAWLADILWPNQDETDKVLTAMLYKTDTNTTTTTNNNTALNDTAIHNNDTNTNVPLAHPNQQPPKDAVTEEVCPRDNDNDNEDDEQKKRNGVLPHDNSSSNDNDNKTKQQIYRIKGIVSVRHLRKDMIDDENDDDVDDDVDDTLRRVFEKGNSETDGDEDVVDNENDSYLDPRRYIVQGVYDLWEIHPASRDLNWTTTTTTKEENDTHNDENEKRKALRKKDEEERVGKIVVIGKYLQQERLKEGFAACFH